MSARNKIDNKYTRKMTRQVSESPAGTIPVGRVPQDISANILSNPKQMRLSGRSRRRLQRGRGLAVACNPEPAGNPYVKIAVSLTKLTLAQLIRRQKQAARRASTCKFLLDDLSSASQFAIRIRAEQTHQISVLKQVTAEIKSRNHQTK